MGVVLGVTSAVCIQTSKDVTPRKWIILVNSRYAMALLKPAFYNLKSVDKSLTFP